MKLEVEKRIVCKEDEHISFRVLKAEKCCDKFLASEHIDLNSEYYFADFDEAANDYVDAYSFKLIRIVEDYDGYPEPYYEKIKFCPFCGEKLIVEVVNEVDREDEMDKLSALRDKLWKQHNKTDSIKKERELKIKVKEIDEEIQNLYCNDNIDNLKRLLI